MGHLTSCRQRPFGGEIHDPESYRSLRLCGEDLRLFETKGPAPRGRQRCRCDAPEQPQIWENWDFAEAYRLCDGCAQSLLHSGSRFSVWFCRACLDELIRARDAVGGNVVPISRHTMMNPGLLLCDGGRLDPLDAESTVKSIFSFGDLIKHLEKWKYARLEHLFRRVANSHETSLSVPVFLRRVEALDPSLDGRKAGALGMLTWFGVTEEPDGRLELSRHLPATVPQPVLLPGVPLELHEIELLREFAGSFSRKAARELRAEGAEALDRACLTWALRTAGRLPVRALRPLDEAGFERRMRENVDPLKDAAYEAFAARFGHARKLKAPAWPDGLVVRARTGVDRDAHYTLSRDAHFVIAMDGGACIGHFHLEGGEDCGRWYLVQRMREHALGDRHTAPVADCPFDAVPLPRDAAYLLLLAHWRATKSEWGCVFPLHVRSAGLLPAELGLLAAENVWGKEEER